MRVVAQNYVGYYMDDTSLPFNRIKWMELAGRPYIWHVVEGLKKCKRIDEIILFTQDTPQNKEVIDLAKRWGLDLRYYGYPQSWDSVLRWYESLKTDIVIYTGLVSALIDLETLDSMIDYFIEKDLDYLRSEEPLGVLSISKSDFWLRIYEVEKDFNKIKKDPLGFLEEKSNLMNLKSGTFGELKDMQILGLRVKWRPLLRKIYDRFYVNSEIINLEEILSFYEEEPEWFEVLFHDQIEIELTNDCNLKCIMCPRQKMKRPIGYMDFNLYKKMIDESVGGRNVIFSLFGEPLMHPDFLKMIDYAKDKVNIILYTNAFNLNEEISRAILENPSITTIFFSLDAATPEAYGKIKGVDAYDKVIGNIHRFLDMRKDKISKLKEEDYGGDIGPTVALQILKMKENDHEIEEFWSRWSQREKIERMLDWRKRCQEIKEKLKPLREEVDGLKRRLNWSKKSTKKPEELKNLEEKFETERKRLYEPLEKLWHKTFYENCDLPIEYVVIGHFNNFCGQIKDRSVVDVTPLKRFPCRQLKAGISVLWNGDVVLCRQDFDGRYPLGNLKNQHLEEIIENGKLEEIWQAHKDEKYDKLPLCKDCKEWYYNLYA
jgi:radical SAM protein with 4Fe4S-binding SPASM domain